MGNYGSNNRSGSGRKFGKGNYGTRSTDKPTMHKAVCDNCGKSCEVPFRPSSDKPVYCNNCFEDKREGGRGERSYDRNNRRSDKEDRQMYSVVCDDCGKNCEVPFKPSNNKPVLCRDCFSGKGGSSSSNNDQNLKQDLNAINDKLDKILKLITNN